MINTNDSSHTEPPVPCWVTSNHDIMKFTTALQVAITKPHYMEAAAEAHRDEVASQAHTGNGGFLQCHMEGTHCQGEIL